MNGDEFVDAVDAVVREGAVASTLKNLAKPPGISPDPDLVEMARWYASLSEADRQILASVVRLVASHAVLGFLSVLDGAQAIEGPPGKGHLELYHVKGNQRVLLNDPAVEPLNDKLRP